MSSIVQNIARVGAFTSSKAYKLMTNGKGPGGIGAPAVTYIEEKNIELRLGRSLDTDAYSKDMAWGGLLEKRVYDLLPFGYELVSELTDVHPLYTYWAGSKDLIYPGIKIGDIKCYQPKNFAILTDVLLVKEVAILKATHPEEYWQLVSNAIIANLNRAESITYMPYQSELPIIRELAENYDGADQWKYRFIAESEDYALAYLPDGGHYKNLNCFEFEIPQEDMTALDKRMAFCATFLVNSMATPIKANAAANPAPIIEDANALKI